MEMPVITAAHWIYLAGVAAIVITMLYRKNVVVPSILATVAVTLAYTGSPIAALASVFNASFVAARELFNIFLVIALMTSLLNALKTLRSDVRMVEPFRKVMVNGTMAYFVLAAITYVISLFFWPTPAVPLVAAILLPAAIAAGLSPMGAAVAIAIAGQGMALSSDYVIGVAPGISAKAAGAGVSAAAVADRALVLSLITGGIALALGYLAVRRGIQAPSAVLLDNWQRQALGAQDKELAESGSFHKSELAHATDQPAEAAASVARVQRWSQPFAVLTPLAFLGVIAVMVLPKLMPSMPPLRGGDAAAMVGGVAGLLMILATLAGQGRGRFLNSTADHITDGLVFAFKAMGAVLPIAGFFFIGGADTAGPILGVSGKAPGLLFELVQSVQSSLPTNHALVAFGVLLVGMITGIDGSGFAGLPLTGTLSGALGPNVGFNTATLCAIGQMGAVWTGGGTLIAWSSLIAVTGFARVPVLEAVRVLFVPVVSGLVVSTICAVLFWS